jgi:hypothetical protein
MCVAWFPVSLNEDHEVLQCHFGFISISVGRMIRKVNKIVRLFVNVEAQLSRTI